MITPVQPFSQNKHTRSNSIAQNGPCRLIDPVLVNGIFDEEADAYNEHQDTYLAEKVLTDELLVVCFLAGSLIFYTVTCRLFCGGADRTLHDH